MPGIYAICKCGHPGINHESNAVPFKHDGACHAVLVPAEAGAPSWTQVNCACKAFKRPTGAKR